MEGYEAIIIGSLNRNELMCINAMLTLIAILYLASISNKPNRNTIYILALSKCIGQSNRNKIIFTEIRNRCAVFILNIKVVNGIISYLTKLFVGNTHILKCILVNNSGRNGYILVTNSVSYALSKLNVGVSIFVNLKLNVCIRQIRCTRGCRVATGSYNRLCFMTYRTSICSLSVFVGIADFPTVSCRILGDNYRDGVAASTALKGFFSVSRTSCCCAYACNVIMMIYGCTQHFFMAALANIYHNVFTIANIANMFFGGSYTDNIVSQRITVRLGICTVTVTLIGPCRCGLAGCLGCQSGVFNIGVRSNVSLVTYITVMIIIGVYVGALFKNCSAAIIADMVIICVGVCVDSHIVLAAFIIADMVKIIVLMLNSRALSCTTLEAVSRCSTSCTSVITSRYISLAAHVTVVVAIICRVKAVFNNSSATIITKVVIIGLRIEMLAKFLSATVVAFMVFIRIFAIT